LACWIAWTQALAAESVWPAEAERLAALEQRRERVIDEAIARIDPQDPSKGSLFDIAATVSRGENLDWARQRIRALNDPPSGAMFWMHPMVLAMYAGRDSWNEDDWAYFRELWRTYFPYRGDTENHWLMYYASLYLVCEMFPEAGGEAWYNGKSSVENMEEARDYLRDWVRVTTSYGQGEFDSPNYIEEYVRPLSLLAGWAQDPEVRQIGRMMLDYILFDFAVEDLNGLYGGAHSRIYPRYTLEPALTPAASHAWLLFGQGEYQSTAGCLMLALSGYTPPAILDRIARDRETPYVQRELKRTRWRLRHMGPETFEIDGRVTAPVYKYSYVHPDFVLGCCQGGTLQPIQQQTWSLIWREDRPRGISNTMFAVQPHASPEEGTRFFVTDWDTVTDLIARSKVDYTAPDKLEGGSPYEQIFQHEGTLIALYDIPEDSRFPHIHTFFSEDLTARTEAPSGWIFAQGGPIYLAYRPFAPGEWRPVDWTGLLHGGAGGWVSSNFAELAGKSELYHSEARQNGYVLQVASQRDFASFAQFQKAVEALPLKFSLQGTPSVRFTTLDGTQLTATYGQPPEVNGAPVDYADWPLFDGPFGHAERGSEHLEMRYDEARYQLDFTDLTRSSSTPSQQ